MESLWRTWRPDGFGLRAVGCYNVSGNAFVSEGAVAWHVRLYRNDHHARIEEYWVEEGHFFKHEGMDLMPADGAPSRIFTGDPIDLIDEKKQAVLTGLALLDAARVSPDRDPFGSSY